VIYIQVTQYRNVLLEKCKKATVMYHLPAERRHCDAVRGRLDTATDPSLNRIIAVRPALKMMVHAHIRAAV